MGCSSPNSLQVETVYSQVVTKPKGENTSGQNRFKPTFKASVAILEPKIVVVSSQDNQIRYEIQSSIASSGLSIQKVRNIALEKQIVGDTLIVNHIAHVVLKPGKESANILGYNYRKEQMIDLPSNIKQIQISLLEQRQFKDPDIRKAKQPRLLTQTSFNVDSN